jgi:hypothetical protein
MTWMRRRITRLDAGIAQLVEHNLAKVGVASSSLVSRSRFKKLGLPSDSPFSLRFLSLVPGLSFGCLTQ